MARALLALAPVLALSPLLAREPATPLRLVSADTQALYQRLFPTSADGRLDKLKADPAVIFYDDEVMPRAYQDWTSAGVATLQSPSYNVSARPDPAGNANREFPWGSPFGTSRGDGHKTYKFIRLPAGRAIVYWRQWLANDTKGPSFVWNFPAGTVVGEVLCVHRAATGHSYTSEVRLRTKVADGWKGDVYRPYARPEQLLAATKKLRPEWEREPATAAFVKALEQPHLESRSIHDGHPSPVLHRTALREVLPAVDDELVVRLLNRPFQSVLGTPWRQTEAGTAHAPTTEAAFHIVTPGSTTYFHPVESKSCAVCHRTALMHARDFDFVRDWYGRVRGSDSTFSFHIFEPGSISYSGVQHPVAVNQRLLAAGLLRPN